MARRFTVAEYDAMLNGGTLMEDTSTELIDGWIVQKDRSGTVDGRHFRVSPRHCYVVNTLAGLSPAFEPHGCYVQTQQPIALPPLDEPEPDASVIRGVLELRKPGPADVVLALEVADGSLEFDLTTKLRVYAKAGVPLYVVVDLRSDRILLHTEPTSEAYTSVRQVGRGQTLALPTARANDVEIAADDLLPPRQR